MKDVVNITAIAGDAKREVDPSYVANRSKHDHTLPQDTLLRSTLTSMICSSQVSRSTRNPNVLKERDTNVPPGKKHKRMLDAVIDVKTTPVLGCMLNAVARTPTVRTTKNILDCTPSPPPNSPVDPSFSTKHEYGPRVVPFLDRDAQQDTRKHPKDASPPTPFYYASMRGNMLSFTPLVFATPNQPFRRSNPGFLPGTGVAGLSNESPPPATQLERPFSSRATAPTSATISTGLMTKDSADAKELPPSLLKSGSPRESSLTSGLNLLANQVLLNHPSDKTLSNCEVACAKDTGGDLTPPIGRRAYVHQATPIPFGYNRAGTAAAGQTIATMNRPFHQYAGMPVAARGPRPSVLLSTGLPPSWMSAGSNCQVLPHRSTPSETSMVSDKRFRHLFSNVRYTDKPCKCPNSNCLKLYCQCFHSGTFCDPKICKCKNCCNNETHNDDRGLRHCAVKLVLVRRPTAFGEPRTRSNFGCACKKSGCMKNYCECHSLGRPCTDKCACVGCKNCTLDGTNKGAGGEVGGTRPKQTNSASV